MKKPASSTHIIKRYFTQFGLFIIALSLMYFLLYTPQHPEISCQPPIITLISHDLTHDTVQYFSNVISSNDITEAYIQVNNISNLTTMLRHTNILRLSISVSAVDCNTLKSIFSRLPNKIQYFNANLTIVEKCNWNKIVKKNRNYTTSLELTNVSKQDVKGIMKRHSQLIVHGLAPSKIIDGKLRQIDITLDGPAFLKVLELGYGGNISSNNNMTHYQLLMDHPVVRIDGDYRLNQRLKKVLKNKEVVLNGCLLNRKLICKQKNNNATVDKTVKMQTEIVAEQKSVMAEVVEVADVVEDGGDVETTVDDNQTVPEDFPDILQQNAQSPQNQTNMADPEQVQSQTDMTLQVPQSDTQQQQADKAEPKREDSNTTEPTITPYSQETANKQATTESVEQKIQEGIPHEDTLTQCQLRIKQLQNEIKLIRQFNLKLWKHRNARDTTRKSRRRQATLRHGVGI